MRPLVGFVVGDGERWLRKGRLPLRYASPRVDKFTDALGQADVYRTASRARKAQQRASLTSTTPLRVYRLEGVLTVEVA